MAKMSPPVHRDVFIDPRDGQDGALGSPLLATKLRVPPPPSHLVPRSQLTPRLAQAVERPLTLIAAPAGFGKTTLLSAWLHHAPVATAWISLDSPDNDPACFWSYTLAALDGVHAGLAASGHLLRSSQPPPFEVLLTTVINNLAALPDDVVLVFDDYHVITARPIHASVTFLLDHLPARLHLVIATRADPPLPLARLRARGQLVEIRSADLRFTREEAASFLAQRVGLELSPDDIAALDARTEGWIAGLQLAALSLQDRQDVSSFLQAFTGTHRFVVDYLTHEVLTCQPPKVQRFLLQTAILDRLCAPLCEAVTGEQAGQAMLERLEDAHLFLLPQDDQRHWYRYHHLFAEMLRQRLQQVQPERVALLHQRASAWYEDHHLIREAVHHALAATDFDRAAQLIEQVADTMVKRGEVATLRTWLATLPDDLVHGRAELGLWHGWLLALDGQYAAAERLLQGLERPSTITTSPPSAIGAAGTPRLDDSDGAMARAGRVAAIRAFMAFRQGNVQRTIELARQAIAQLSADTAARGLAAWNLGIAYCLSGDLAAGTASLIEARAISQAAGDSYTAFMITFELARMQGSQGHLHRAEQSYRQALDLAAKQGRRLAATGPIYVGRGDLQREWNHLDAAVGDLQEGIAQCQQTGNIVILLLGCVSLARAKQAQGDEAGARDLIHTIEQNLSTHYLSPHNSAQLAAWHARLSLQWGDLAVAWRWAQDRQLRVDDAPNPAREIEFLTWARLLIVQHQPAAATQLLEGMLRAAERQGRMGDALEILVLLALAHQARGNEVGALEKLSRALSLAEPEGYVRLFVDEGAPMAHVLRQMRTRMPRHTSQRYREQLLVLMGDASPSATAVTESALGLAIDPLSDRELEVLRLIVAGCSNREIADRLVIAVSTVKWYVNTIYAKLQVESRTKAIVRAKELNIS